MVWSAFSKRGKAAMVFVHGKQNGKDHTETLKTHLLPYIDEKFTKKDGVKPLFQQDRASIHMAKVAQSWLQAQDFEIMDWAAQSPDLNPMENAWGILTQKVYGGDTKQYQSKKALKAAILKAWDEVEQSTLDKLVDSFETRLRECIKVKGKKTKY